MTTLEYGIVRMVMMMLHNDDVTRLNALVALSPKYNFDSDKMFWLTLCMRKGINYSDVGDDTVQTQPNDIGEQVQQVSLSRRAEPPPELLRDCKRHYRALSCKTGAAKFDCARTFTKVL